MKFNETQKQEAFLNYLMSNNCQWPNDKMEHWWPTPLILVTREQFEARDGWIVWRCGEQPVGDDVLIDVKWPGGKELTCSASLVVWWSSTEGGDGCFYYRLHKAGQVEQPKPHGHPYAELMMQYAEDAKTNAEPWLLWEMKVTFNGGHQWMPLDKRTFFTFTEKEYRRKPKTKLIHGVEVPEFNFHPSKNGDRYYTPSVTALEFHVVRTMRGCKMDNFNRKHGLMYPHTEEGKKAAIIHAKAMLGINDD